MVEKVIKVDGMTCSHCAETVKRAINNIEGVKHVEVDLESGKVTIRAERELSCDEIKRAVEEWDYKVVDC